MSNRAPLTAIQGGPGSYHEVAASNFGLGAAELSFQPTFNDLFKELASGGVGEAIAAIANNRFNIISDTMSALMSGSYAITGETYVRVEHQLLGIAGTSLDEIREVHSQAPALGQCNEFLHSGELHSGVKRVEQDDTAVSAELVALWQDPTKAAIASARAGELHGLSVLKPNVQDDPDNITRFLRLEKLNGQITPSDADKSTLLLNTGQKPGALVEALLPLKEAGINMASLHSSFIPNSPFSMRFLVDVEAGADDPRLQVALEGILRAEGTYTMLGSYAKAIVPVSYIGNEGGN